MAKTIASSPARRSSLRAWSVSRRTPESTVYGKSAAPSAESTLQGKLTRAEPFALLIAELDDVLFNGNLFRAHDSSPGFPEPSIQLESAEFSATFRRPIACARSLRATAP